MKRLYPEVYGTMGRCASFMQYSRVFSEPRAGGTKRRIKFWLIDFPRDMSYDDRVQVADQKVKEMLALPGVIHASYTGLSGRMPTAEHFEVWVE